MKVDVSVFGRFHAFDLAKQLNRAECLNNLFTTYPSYKVKEWGIDSKKIKSSVPLEVLNRLNKRLHLDSDWFNDALKTIHAKNVAKRIDSDFFIGWSGTSLESIIEAKRKGVTTILERGSCHFSYQQELLASESEQYGVNYSANYYSWQKELLEYELADYISIPSTFVKRSFIQYGVPERKLIVNPYGVDLDNFKQEIKEDNVFRVIYCGALSIQKGSHYLLKAFHELNLPNSELWHIGGISNEMKPFVNKYKSKKIIYKGSYPQRELHMLYSQGDVFVLPSVQDGFGMVVFQAMACGLPVILTENTAGYDAVKKDGEEGFVIPTHNSDAIKEKLQYFYENPDARKYMGENAKHRVSSGFKWSDYGYRYINALNDIKSGII